MNNNLDRQPLHSRTNKPVTLEALMQVKRAEKPAPEFWQRFEQELEQKRLQALVDTQPWGQRIRNWVAWVTIPGTVMGATAAAVALWVGVLPMAPDWQAGSDVVMVTESAKSASSEEVSAAVNEMHPDSHKAFALDTMSLQRSGLGVTPVSGTERFSPSHNSTVRFVSGSLNTVASSSPSSFY